MNSAESLTLLNFASLAYFAVKSRYFLDRRYGAPGIVAGSATCTTTIGVAGIPGNSIKFFRSQNFLRMKDSRCGKGSLYRG